jgi:hypothetical protein
MMWKASQNQESWGKSIKASAAAQFSRDAYSSKYSNGLVAVDVNNERCGGCTTHRSTGAGLTSIGTIFGILAGDRKQGEA